MKYIKRILAGILLLAIASIIINSQTRFFKDIDKNIPFMGENFPKLCDSISTLAEDVDTFISNIPTPRELYARVRNVELPIDPEDIAENVYYSNDIMLNFYTHRNISVSVTDNMIDIFGITKNENDLYLVYQILDKNGEVLHNVMDYTDPEGKFRRQVKIPEDAYQLAIYTGKERSGEFTGYVYDYILLDNINGKWQIKNSPVYEDNVSRYEKSKSRSGALRHTYAIPSKNGDIIELAHKITEGCETDYDRALAIHDWVARNIYYDSDSITDEGNTAPYLASEVISEARAVCLGYANLYATLCRSLDIPCNVVTGYALGVGTGDSSWSEENINTYESNHAWNEVYIDNRWVIVDTTWDSRNKIENSKKITDTNISHLYFDANLKFFSTNHKIIEYKK